MRIAHVITRLILGGAQENTVLCCEDLMRDYRDQVLLITGPPLGPEGSLLRGQAACGRYSTSASGGAGGEAADWINLEVEADGFLYNMARAIAGTLVEVGRGAQPESWPADVLQAADRAAARAFSC